MWYYKFRVVYWGECKRVATGVVAGENFVEVNKRLCDYYEDDSIEELSISSLDLLIKNIKNIRRRSNKYD